MLFRPPEGALGITVLSEGLHTATKLIELHI